MLIAKATVYRLKITFTSASEKKNIDRHPGEKALTEIQSISLLVAVLGVFSLAVIVALQTLDDLDQNGRSGIVTNQRRTRVHYAYSICTLLLCFMVSLLTFPLIVRNSTYTSVNFKPCFVVLTFPTMPPCAKVR